MSRHSVKGLQVPRNDANQFFLESNGEKKAVCHLTEHLAIWKLLEATHSGWERKCLDDGDSDGHYCVSVSMLAVVFMGNG